MKRFLGYRLDILLVTLVAGGCLATDPPVEQIEPPELVTFEDVQVGAAHACGLTTRNEILCWGENSIGQLGTGDRVFRAVPWPVSNAGNEFRSVVAGASHSCAISMERAVFCWGANAAGQLGQGNIADSSSSVPLEVSSIREYSDIAAGGAHSCVVTVDGNAYCWGSGTSGQLGTGYLGFIPRPVPELVLGDHPFQEITAGEEHTCGVTVNGDGYCWGKGEDGRLGIGSNENASEPVRIGDMAFSAISAGGNHTCALGLDAIVFCWGSGSEGQLGTGGTTSSNEPVPVAGGHTFTSISTGNGYTCGIVGSGSAYCWGRNDAGQLGDGSLEDRLEPALVAGGLSFVSVSAGDGFFGTATCGLASDGLAYCWGDGRTGQTGTGDEMLLTAPVRVYGQEN